ncbi:hypothetical protein [Blastococcus sp. TF02A-26]|uniref:hypothetical protein n=1 Tax=Blastococcus sp. TF02A-26 TaxID=2250577 RepID=UPI000DE86995|nr:hypothetical protein [Blastococcus sp. TF02A-26]RBY85187.1 hypothetical protein DQ240_13285 [Blastococcus sp. TF02A-26]
MDTALRPAVPLPAVMPQADGQPDAAQEFVNRLRSAAPAFAVAAGADTAVVREVVPPARHRRARCRLVLRFPGEVEVDLTFLGAVSRGSVLAEDFDALIENWLASDRSNESAWLVSDDESPDGLAIDVTAWAQLQRSAAV